jgi:hypothetical protein
LETVLNSTFLTICTLVFSNLRDKLRLELCVSISNRIERKLNNFKMSIISDFWRQRETFHNHRFLLAFFSPDSKIKDQRVRRKNKKVAELLKTGHKTLTSFVLLRMNLHMYVLLNEMLVPKWVCKKLAKNVAQTFFV